MALITAYHTFNIKHSKEVTNSFLFIKKSDCTNNTECKTILDECNNECNGIVHWDDNSTMLICTDGCPLQKYVYEL